MTGYARLVAPVVVVSLLFGALPAQAGSGPASARVRVVASAPAGVSPASAKPVGMEVASQAGVESAGLTVGSAAVAGDTGQGSRDAEDASALALRSGQRVAIESLTTGTDLVWATPSGAVGREIYGSPVRVRRGGAWVPVDTSLVAGSAGWWVPRAGLADVAVSDKPAGAAVRVRVDGATARLGSVVKRSGSPRVSGSSMVWPSGLTVSALKQGVSLSWPFTTGREVAEGAVVGELRAGVRGARWRRIRATGGVALVGAGGARLGSLGPVLVESAARRRSGDPVAVLRLRLVPVGSGATARLRLVATSAIPTGFRGRANHSWASGGASDTWVQKNLYETSQQSSTQLRAGVGGTVDKARSYLKFNTSALNGHKIASAIFDMTQFDPAAGVACKAGGPPIWARRASEPVDYAALTWSNQPASATAGQAVVPCAGTVAGLPNTARADVTEILQYWSDYPDRNYGFKVMIDGTDEGLASAANTLRKYRSANFISGDDVAEPHIYAEYNLRPAIEGPVVGSPPIDAGVLMSTGTVFSARVTDPEGEAVRLRADVYSAGESSPFTTVYSDFGASGHTASVSMGPVGLAPGGSYRIVFRASDGLALGVPTAQEVLFRVNRAPDTPAGLSVPSVADHRPTLRVGLSDPDGAQPITPVFQVRRSGDAEPSWEWQGGSVPPGSHDFVWGGDALPSGLLEVRALARNTADRIPEYTLWSPASGWVAFQVGPPGPTITSSAWPADGSWLAAAPADPGFTFTAVGAVRFSYRVDDQPAVEVPAAGGTAQVSLEPAPGPGGHTLTVTALDAGGNRSPPATFRFGIGQATISTPVAQARSSRTFRIRATAPAGMTGASIQWRAVGSSEWTSGPSILDLTSTADSSSLVYVWDTTQGPGAITQGQRPLLIEVRVTFANPTGPLSVVQQVSVTQSFGGAYATVQGGPCAVSVATGECQLTATDADLPGYGQSLSVGRAWYSQSDLTRRAADDRGVFGPGWVADLPGADGSGMSATVSANVGDDPGADWIVLTYPDGLVDMFTRTMAGDDGDVPTDSFEPVGESRQDGSRLQLTGSQLQLFEDDGTVTTWTGAGQAWTAVSVTSPGVNVATRFLVVTTGGVEDRAAISGVTTANTACAEELTGSAEQILTQAKATPGCRVLETVLAPATTAAPGAPGAFAGQVDRVLATYFHPDGDGGAMASVELARYAYDTAGRLVAVWDPRISPPLVTRYSYTPSGQLRTVGPASAGTASSPAIIPWVLDFNTENRLTTTSRERPDGDTAVTRLVPLDPAADGSLPAGLPDVRPGEVARWAGTKVGTVTTGVAVFGPDHPVSGTPDASDWPHAQLTLVDSLGRQILDGEYGSGQWLLNTTGYTPDNAVTWQLTAGNRARIGLDGPCTAAAAVCGAADTATRADLLASITIYDPGQPSVVTDTWGPAIDTVTDDGRAVTGRAHTHTRYYFQDDPSLDEATGLPWRVPTRTTESTYLITGADPARLDDSARDVDAHVTTMTYRASIGGQDGLPFRTPTTTTVDPGGLNLVTRVALDSAGRTVVEAPPGHDPDDAGATHTTYYTASGSFTPNGCEARPAWVGMVCAITPGGPISTGVAAPARRIDYDQLLLPRRTTLTANGATTTTEITRDPAGRETLRTVTGGAPGDTPVGPVVTSYDPNTGQVANTWDQATDLVQAGRYDAWARPEAFTDQATADANGAPQPGTGNTTTTSYDAAGRIRTTDDGVIRAQYRYDQPGDYRGLVSELVYTRSSGAALYAAAASYDIDGQPDNAEVGPGLRLTERSDAAGNTTTRRYESDAGARLAAWTSLPNTAGQTRDLQRNGTQGAAAGQAVTDRRQTFTYDHADRLVRADDQTTAPDGASTCTMRDYTYRPDGARTASTSGTAAAMPDSDLAATCSGSVTQTAARTHSVNAWAQITATTLTGANPGSGNYTYDPLGRVVGLPAVDSPAGTPADTALGHFADGLPHTTTINGSTRTWARDPAGRLAAWTDTIPGQPDTSGTNHYDDPTGDSPAWTRNNDGTTTTWLTGPDGTLATSLTIAADDTLTGQGVLIDPLGATTATLALAADPADTTWTPETLQPAADIDEYGVTLPGATTSTLTGGPGNTLGWHAQNQRPTNTTTGLVALGVRQYNPVTGQFLSPDPIPGGNTTPYTHPQDPINQADLDGRVAWVVGLVFVPGLGQVVAALVVGGVAVYAGYSAYKAAKSGIAYAKTSRKSGKEKASDAPSWVRGQRRGPRSSQQAADDAFRDHYGRRPTKSEKGPGSEWSQARKYFDRQPR